MQLTPSTNKKTVILKNKNKLLKPKFEL